MSSLDASRLYSGAVYDALHELGVPITPCVLPENIKPLAPGMQMYGPALLCYGERCSSQHYSTFDRNRLAIYDCIPPGCVVVLQADDEAVAHAGDIGLLVCELQGAVGFVTDGLVRDTQRIIDRGFPCFASGITPIDAVDYWAWIGIADTALIKGVLINRGDWVFGDADGVLRIPADAHADFERLVQVKLQHEQWVREQLCAESDVPLTERIRRCYARGRW